MHSCNVFKSVGGRETTRGSILAQGLGPQETIKNEWLKLEESPGQVAQLLRALSLMPRLRVRSLLRVHTRVKQVMHKKVEQ